MNLIPKNAEPYKRTEHDLIRARFELECAVPQEHTALDGTHTRVVAYYRYPSYDMIFAIPFPDTERAEKEKGYFEFRDTRKGGKKWSLWVDQTEAEECMRGFRAIAEAI